MGKWYSEIQFLEAEIYLLTLMMRVKESQMAQLLVIMVILIQIKWNIQK